MITRAFNLTLIFLLSSFAGEVSLAESTSKWTNIGPLGAWIRCLAIDPQNPEILYAGTPTGVFKSTDGGQNWNKVNSALNVFSLAIDPKTPSTVYASSYGVFKSIDGGGNWFVASSGLPSLPTLPRVDVGALAIDPQNPNTLYAGTRTGVYKSQDGGASWYATNSASTTFPAGPARAFQVITRLAIDPQQPTTVYAVGIFLMYVDGSPWGYSGAMFKTTDGGDTWNVLALPDSRGTRFPSSVAAVAIDPQNPSMIYVSGGFPSSLLKSSDRGASWQSLSMPVSTLAIDPNGSNTLYAGTSKGILKSTDGGTSWTTAGSGLPIGAGGFVLAIDPKDPNTVYTPGAGGLFKTTDGGANWTMLNAGLSTAGIQTIVVDPENSGLIYATGDWGAVRTTDDGATWSSVDIGYPSIIAIDPQNPRTLYAANQQGDQGPYGVLFKSIDGGSSWSAAMSGLPIGILINALVIDSANPNIIYAGTDQGLFESSDAATGWTAAGLPGISTFAVAINPRNSNTVYAGGSAGVFRSMDAGITWNAFDFPANRTVSVLAIDPQNPNTVYAGAAGAIFKSTDAGTNWTSASSGLPANPNWISALVIDPQNPSTLYAGTTGAPFGECSIPCSGFNDGVFKSTDAGASWIAVDEGLTTPHISALALDPHNPNRLYAGTIGGGVFTIAFR